MGLPDASRAADVRVDAPFDPKGGHVQGMCKGEDCYYLSQMTRLFKIGLDGRCVKSLPVISHTGDLCFYKGRVYTSVAVYGGPRKGQGLIQVYDADLNLLREKYYPRGMDGIACLNDKLYVGNGCHRETVPHPEGKEPQSKTPHPDNDMAIVDPETLELERTVVYSHGAKTRYGAQNIVSDGKGLYISFYAATANDPDLVYYDAELKPVSRYRANVSNGFVCTGETNGCPLFLKCETTNRNGTVEATLKEGVAAKSPEVRVVAHRGGAVEAGLPDNSRAALSYAKSVGCWASECDIYLTADNDVIVAHADGECRVNGLHPWEATAAQLRAAGKLANGEELPRFAEYLDLAKALDIRLLIDIKRVSRPTNNVRAAVEATRRACEIAREAGETGRCLFICTGDPEVMAGASKHAKAAGIPIAWMNPAPPADYIARGYDWANLCTSRHFKKLSPEDYLSQGVQLSIFHLDREPTDANAVTDPAEIDRFLRWADRYRCVTTNYPKWLLARLGCRKKGNDK